MREETSYTFKNEQISSIQKQLLRWYGENVRDLPWRRAASTDDKQQHAYAVWVSEIMLQQTRVVTVIDYYKKWMSKWPTVRDLAKANLEQVNEVWAGLGYYSRARRLHEGANKIVKDLKGQIPNNAADLMKLIPGVGRYTAAAISSIAFNEPVGVLDGNVIRVLSRLLTIGGDVSSKNVLDHLWSQVDKLIPSEGPGDFNQAIMELGALICTPKSPACSKCPLQNICAAYEEAERRKKQNLSITSNKLFGKVRNLKRKYTDDKMSASKRVKVENENSISNDISDIESCVTSNAFLCFPPGKPWLAELGVTNYPRKADKKPPRQETAVISVVEIMETDNEPEILITQRPEAGLLAKLWEFPAATLTKKQVSEKNFVRTFAEKNTQPSKSSSKYISEFMAPMLEKYLKGYDIIARTHVGELTHIFSHIHLRYIIEHVIISRGTKCVATTELMTNSVNDEGKVKEENVSNNNDVINWKWVEKSDLPNCAMSSAMQKILRVCDTTRSKKSEKSRTAKSDRNQAKLDSFFAPKSMNKRSKMKENIVIKKE